jgi:hypothetical protein
MTRRMLHEGLHQEGLHHVELRRDLLRHDGVQYEGLQHEGQHRDVLQQDQRSEEHNNGLLRTEVKLVATCTNHALDSRIYVNIILHRMKGDISPSENVTLKTGS